MDSLLLEQPARPLRRIRNGGTKNGTGKAFDAVISSVGIVRGDGVRDGAVLVPPRGLVIGLTAASTRAAECLLTIGATGGGELQRRFTLSAAGVWLSVAGWETVRLEVVSRGADDVVVYWAWTTEGSPGNGLAGRLLYVESIAAGTAKVPAGAVRVAPSVADAGWVWVSEAVSGTPLSVSASLSSGVEAPVNGDRYTATVANVLAWELWPP